MWVNLPSFNSQRPLQLSMCVQCLDAGLPVVVATHPSSPIPLRVCSDISIVSNAYEHTMWSAQRCLYMRTALRRATCLPRLLHN
jgi:hypothetical protein